MKIFAIASVALILRGIAADEWWEFDPATSSRLQGLRLRRAARQSQSRAADKHESAGLIQFKTGSGAAATMTAKLREAKVELIRATQAAATEKTKAIQIKTELTKAIKVQHNLGSRLQQVSTETRASLASLLAELKVAKAAAERSEAFLQEEIREENGKLRVAEASELALRTQLSSAEASAAIASQSAATAMAKAAAEQKVDRKALDNLKSELKSARESSQKEVAELNEKLTKLRESDAKEQVKLKEQMKAFEQAAVKDKSEIESRMKDLSRSAEKNQDDLEAERFTEKILANNVTSVKEEAELEAAKARKERMGLLSQVSELQAEASNAQKRTQSAQVGAKSAKEDADKKAKALAVEAKRQQSEHDHRIAALLQETQVAHANLSAATTAAELARQKISDLQAVVSREGEQLRVALLESEGLKSARDAAWKGQATFQRLDMTAETALNETHQELASAENQLKSMKVELASHLNDASVLSNKCKQLQTQLANLQQASANEEAKVRQQTHDSMISAAAKVHELEDQNDQLRDEIKEKKQELQTAAAESAKAKDTLIQQTDASLKASHRADSLQNTLNQFQKEADTNNAHVDDFARQAARVQDERDRSKAAILAKAAAQTELEAKVEALEESKKSYEATIAKIQSEDKKLEAQMHDLSGEESRSDELEEELASVRKKIHHKEAEESKMAKKLEMLRSLKDHYSADNEEIKKEAVEQHQKAEDLEDELQNTKHRLAAMTKQKAKALLRAKQARSQEDEYFQENSKLQQQDEALNSQIAEVGAESNRTDEENLLLQTQVDDMASQAKREKDNSKAAMEENKAELQQARQDLKDSQSKNEDIRAELLRMQAVLNDTERREVGLPPLKMVAVANPVTTKPMPTPITAPAPTGASAPPQKVASQQLRRVASIAQTTKATQLAQLPGEPAKPTDDAAATLASVTNPKATSSRSALQKLTDFFASPLPAPLPR